MSEPVTLTLIPPPPPLLWVFPELGFGEPERRYSPGFDLQHCPLRGQSLAKAILDSNATIVSIPTGHEGDALHAMLRRRLRGEELAFDRVLLNPSPYWMKLDWIHGESDSGCLVGVGWHGDSVRIAKTPWNAPPEDTDRSAAAWVLPLKVSGHGIDLPAGCPSWDAFFARWHRHRVVPLFPRGPVATRPGLRESVVPPTLGHLVPSARPGSKVHRDLQEIWAASRSPRLPEFLALENTARLGLDVYAQALDGRWWQSPAESTAAGRPKALIVAISGVDGSGKSTHAQSLKDWVEAQGRSATIIKMYRHGVFHDTVTDLNRRSLDGGPLSLWRLERLAKVFDSVMCFFSRIAPALTSHDVVIFDRYVDTHLAAALGKLQDDAYALELLKAFPEPDLLVLLDASDREALERIDARSARTIDENPFMLRKYREGFESYARCHGWPILDSSASFDDNQQAIRERVIRLWSRGGREAGA